MSWKPKDFEDYLMEVCFKQNSAVLDDDRPDFFDDWICNLEPHEWLEYGEKYKRGEK